MLLFDSLHMATTAMNASQLGIQVAGQNLTNANTPGYVREQMLLETGTTRELGSGVSVGTGVHVNSVVQVIDRFLEERLRTSNSDAMSSATQSKYYSDLEALLNELTENDLSTSLDDFFNSIDEVNNHPGDDTYREMVIDQGEKLAESINDLATSIVGLQRDINTEIGNSATEINRLLKDIEELNRNITLVEAGNGNNEALGLRDQRLNALTELSLYINIKTHEDSETGKVSIYCGSDILLMDGVRNEVYVSETKDQNDAVTMAEIRIKKTGTQLDVRSGGVKGLYDAHQTVLSGYLDKLNRFSYELIKEFNGIYASGQGSTGYDHLTSLVRVDNPEEPLSTAGLDFPIVNGGFNVQVYDTKTKTTTDWNIPITVKPSPQEDPFSLKPPVPTSGTTLQDIADSINNVTGLTAKVNLKGELEITSENKDTQFSFSRDTSGILTALGINAFFTGSTAASIGVNTTLDGDPTKFAASLGGIGYDNANAVRLAAMTVTANPNLGGQSITEYYSGIVSETMLAAGTMKSVAASDALYQQSLQTQRDSISGVNIDEETINMMTYQRMYQANSKYISIINAMLDSLINM